MATTQTQTLDWTLSNDELDKRYRMLCKRLHPDANMRRNDEDTTKEFQQLSSMYERIKKYRSEILNIDLSVSLSEIYHGCIKDIVVNHPDPDNALGTHNALSTPNIVLPIFIPMGIMDGTIITLTTEYGGKVKVKIHEVNDTRFIRDGFNLIVHLDITLAQALISDHVKMGHFNGTLSIPTQIPHSNYRHIVPGMGMPIPTASESGGVPAGDLYVVYNIILPQTISSEFAQELLDLT